MKVILANSNEVEVYMVTGAPVRYNGQSRDSLTFVMPATYSLDEVDAMFNEEACEAIKLSDENGEYIYNGYTIRFALKKETVELDQSDSNVTAVTEDRIFVTMAQRSYSENQMASLNNQMASLTETVDVLVMESLMA